MIKSVCLLALTATLFSFTNPKTTKEMTMNLNPEVPKLASDIHHDKVCLFTCLDGYFVFIYKSEND